MAQFYKRNKDVKLETMAPDPEGIQASEAGVQAGRKEGIKAFENIGKAAGEQYDIETKIYRKQNENLGKTVIENAYVTYPDDPVKFNEVVQSSMGEIMGNIQTAGDKKDFLISMNLETSARQAKVERNFDEKRDRMLTDQINLDLAMVTQEIEDNPYVFYDGAVLDAADRELKTKMLYKKEIVDGEISQVVDGRDIPATDMHGNQRVSTEKLRAAKELSDNIQHLAVVDYFSRTYAKNPIQAQKVLDDLKVKRGEMQDKYGRSDKYIDNAIKGMEAVIQNQKSPEQLVLETRTKLQTETAYKNFDTDEKTGEVKNKKLKNMTSFAALSNQLDSAYPAYANNPTSRAKWAAMKSFADKNYIEYLTKEQKVGRHWGGEPKTVQDAVIDNADNFLFSQDLIYAPGKTSREAALANGDYYSQYASVTREIIQTAKDAGIELNSSAPADKAAINEISKQVIDRTVKTKFPVEYEELKQQYGIKPNEPVPQIVAYRAMQKGETKLILDKRMPTPQSAADLYVVKTMF